MHFETMLLVSGKTISQITVKDIEGKKYLVFFLFFPFPIYSSHFLFTNFWQTQISLLKKYGAMLDGFGFTCDCLDITIYL